MIHYTLNTGHSRVSPRDEVSRDVIAMLAPMMRPGNYPIPGPGAGHVLNVPIATGRMYLATVYAPGVEHPRPCVTFGVAPDDAAADGLWPLMESEYYRVTELPGLRAADFEAAKRPASAPWVAAIVLLGTPEECEWIADMERCIAWAWVEKCRTQ